MKVTKGQRLHIKHQRKGKFVGIAAEDFDTEVAEFFPIVLASEYVAGLGADWETGERIACRRNLCQVEIL